jgi:hypothetical protein
MMQRENHVRQLLKIAFGDVPCPDWLREIQSREERAHEFYLELRRDFYNYEPEEVRCLLPLILEDMMNTRTGDDIDTEDAERLVMQLDPYMLNNAIVRKIKLAQFSGFTKEQAQAICEWLLLAKTWNDLSRFIEYVDAAINYWCQHDLK